MPSNKHDSEPTGQGGLFRNLRTALLVYGICMGILFPLLVRLILRWEQALSAGFFALCLMSGVLAGLISGQLGHHVVRRSLAQTWASIQAVLERMRVAETLGLSRPSPERGVANCAEPRQPTTFQEQPLVQIEQAFRVLAAIALQELDPQRAALDGLTHLLNRQLGLRRLEEEFWRAIRYDCPLGVLLIGVDQLRQINDAQGSEAGDRILCQVAATLTTHLRQGDVVCRYAGDEFLVLAPHTGLTEGTRLAERLRREIEHSEVTWEGQRLAVTASVGVVAWPMADLSAPRELLSAAERALQAAKRDGRNRIVALQGYPSTSPRHSR